MKNGWISKDQIYIPEVRKKGFQSSVIIRNYIPPKEKIKSGYRVENKGETTLLDETHQDEKTILLDETYPDEETVLLSDEYVDDEATVLLQEIPTAIMYIKHIRTNTIIKIDSDQFIIGKSSVCDYVIEGNPTVSRKHARIYKENNEFWLEDLESSNHTYIDDEKIDGPVKLYANIYFRLSRDEEFEVLDIGVE